MNYKGKYLNVNNVINFILLIIFIGDVFSKKEYIKKPLVI